MIIAEECLLRMIDEEVSRIVNSISFQGQDVRRNSMDRETCRHLTQFYDGLFGDLNL